MFDTVVVFLRHGRHSEDSGRRSLAAAITTITLLAFTASAGAAHEDPIVTLTPSQEKSLGAMYFNCDHEGELGCLELTCRQAKLSRQDAAEVQYLYRGVHRDFPELVTKKLRACFVRAGGRFR